MKRLIALAFAVAVLAACVQARAETLKMAASLTLPPYIFKETGRGIDIDIVRQALKRGGYDIQPVYVTYGRLPKELADGKVDGSLTLSRDTNLKGVYYSLPYICYQNVAASLAKNGFGVKSVKDLGKLRMVAFQQAKEILGPEYAAAADKSPDYREIPDQESQVAMLFKGRTDAVIMDQNILTWYRTHISTVDTSPQVAKAMVFPPSCYSVGFTSERMRDAFDNGLKALVRSGRYKDIFTRYGIRDVIYPDQLKPLLQ